MTICLVTYLTGYVFIFWWRRHWQKGRERGRNKILCLPPTVDRNTHYTLDWCTKQFSNWCLCQLFKKCSNMLHNERNMQLSRFWGNQFLGLTFHMRVHKIFRNSLLSWTTVLLTLSESRFFIHHYQLLYKFDYMTIGDIHNNLYSEKYT